MDTLETITCRRCDRVFFVCHSCYRGQVYCQQSCRDEARAQQVRQANQTYMATLKGQERRAAAVEAFRARQRSGLESAGPPPMPPSECNRSRSSVPRSPMASWSQTARCSLCGRPGRVIDPVARR
jgi:hypothetical protein